MSGQSHAHLNHKLILQFTLISLIAVASGTIFRPLFVELPSYFTVMGSINTVLIFSVYLFIRSHRFPAYEMAALFFVAVISIIPLIAISGGVNSQFAFLLPLYPIMATLFGSKKQSIIIGMGLLIAIILCTALGKFFVDLTGEAYNHSKSISRGFWLAMSVLVSTYFGLFFQNRYRALTNELEQLAQQDPLTSLLNRRGFDIKLKASLAEAKRQHVVLSILLIDIDFFKSINDRYGHDIGDTCLKYVADCLKHHIRQTDVLARFGGEEFILLLPDTSHKAAFTLAEKLRHVVSDLNLNELDHPLTVTIGIASTQLPHQHIDDIIKAADLALYQGKMNGRNRSELATDLSND